jgi:hypothetical protein
LAAQLLLKPEGTLYLVCSGGVQGTGRIAERLAAQFPQNPSRLVPVDHLKTSSIRDEITRYLAQTPPDQPIGLNYTGGTKMMAVHAYAAVADFCRLRGREVVFSYLDADSMELLIEEQPGRPALRRNVALAVDLSLEKLLDLHGIRCSGALQPEPMLPELAAALAQQNSSDAGIKAWQAGRVVLKAAEGRLWGEVRAELERLGVMPDVMDRLAAACGFAPEKPIAWGEAASQAGFKSPRQLHTWLDGFWLESWTLECIKRLGHQERSRDINCQSPNPMGIDVAVLRGYQLFALSCGVTTDEHEATIKPLEIFTRGRQLGGDEARVAFVGIHDDPQKIQQKLRLDWDAGKRIRVFGRSQLLELTRHLRDWFESM